MIRRLGIRGKLLAAVAMPTIVLLFAAGFVIITSFNDLTAARNTDSLVGLLEQADPLVDTLHDERDLLTNYTHAVSDGSAKRITARQDLDRAVASLQQLANDNPSLQGPTDQVATILAGGNGTRALSALRELGPVEDPGGGWPTWPEATEVEAMQADYDALADAIAGVSAGSAPEDFRNALVDLPRLLRLESRDTARFLTEPAALQLLIAEAIPETDRAISAFNATGDQVARSETNAFVTEELDFLDAEFTDELTTVRSAARARSIQPAAIEGAYEDMLDSLLTIGREVQSLAPDAQLASLLSGYNDMTVMVDAVRREGQYVERAIRQGYWVLGEYGRFQELYYLSNITLDRARETVNGLSVEELATVPEFGASFDQFDQAGFEQVRDTLANSSDPLILANEASSNWPLQVEEELVVQEPIRADLLERIDARASSLLQTSLLQTLATALITIATTIASIVVAIQIARRITGPLRRLTTTATAVRQELPRLVERVAMPGETVDVTEVQIPVESEDEVGRLAEAFNSVNAATLSVAAEQAALRGSISEMFVNVARRDQVLLNRQLASIDEMERTEEDPETLTKLFALDHLATRMRRNSESLLVLAGIDTGRRLRRPMPLSDVIRTASSEIELYERVQLELDADPSMLGHSALTAAHMFAELLENATVFSDPGTPVVVRTMTSDGSFVVTVTDSGIGMNAQEVQEANARVASTAASEILGAQRLGLFVVGRIARRVGARVEISSREGEGTVATVIMPSSLFDATVAYSTDHQSAGVADGAMHAPSALVGAHEEADQLGTPSVATSSPQAPTQPAQPEQPAQPMPAGMQAYQPTVIEEGTSLSGRVAPSQELPAAGATPGLMPDDPTEPAFVPGRGSEANQSRMLDDLVAQDAANAPQAQEVDLSALTADVSAAGLPTRRRRSMLDDGAPESPRETSSLLGLPSRASEEQLSALESAAGTGFQPILAADEVSPESAEARAKMFRGFRARRGDDEDAPQLGPEAESFGQAVRRGAVAPEPGTGPVPSLEPEPAPQPEPQPEPQQSQPPAHEPEPAEQAQPVLAVDPVDVRDEAEPQAVQHPAISMGFEHEQFAASRPATHDVPLVIPGLEEDRDEVPARASEPAAPAPVAQEEPAAEAAPRREPLYPGTSEHSAWNGQQEAEAPSQGGPATSWEQPGQPAWGSSSQPTQAPSGGHAAPFGLAHSEIPFDSDPVTSTPSLDDLILDGAHAERQQRSQRGGFFTRLFGKSEEPEPAFESLRDPGRPLDPVTGATPIQAPQSGAVPWGSQEPPAPEPAQSGGFEPSGPSLYSEADRDVDYATGGIPTVDQQASQFAPQESAPRSQGSFEPAEGSAPSPVGQWPFSGATPAAPSGQFPTQQAPQWNQPAPEPQWQEAELQEPRRDVFSPDQLATPLGWEQAGASALQAAQPEVNQEYQPVVQVDPQRADGGSTDVASEVFSELSSLTAERPKVVKTSAGLTKRTPVEPKPEAAEEPVYTPHDRDAEGVRDRFSSFYSGTRRAREDAAQPYADSSIAPHMGEE